MKFSECGKHFMVDGLGLHVKIEPVSFQVRVSCVDGSGNNDSYDEQKKANAVCVPSGELVNILPDKEVQEVSLGYYRGG